MRPPVKKLIDAETTAIPADNRTEALQEMARLAQHLHGQGVNPLRWTEAHPAPEADQAAYQATGLKPRDNQFEAGGTLYNWSPAVTATRAQAKAIADAYIASLYNSHRAESVSNYGARVARIFDEKLWQKKNAPLVGWPSRTPKQ